MKRIYINWNWFSFNGFAHMKGKADFSIILLVKKGFVNMSEVNHKLFWRSVNGHKKNHCMLRSKPLNFSTDFVDGKLYKCGVEL